MLFINTIDNLKNRVNHFLFSNLKVRESNDTGVLTETEVEEPSPLRTLILVLVPSALLRMRTVVLGEAQLVEIIAITIIIATIRNLIDFFFII